MQGPRTLHCNIKRYTALALISLKNQFGKSSLRVTPTPLIIISKTFVWRSPRSRADPENFVYEQGCPGDTFTCHKSVYVWDSRSCYLTVAVLCMEAVTSALISASSSETAWRLLPRSVIRHCAASSVLSEERDILSLFWKVYDEARIFLFPSWYYTALSTVRRVQI